ncbi:hypothetical protein ASPCAL12512 [Aspergillus calidoustus]|uniref:Cyanovirin-N domain-containing protein n=1 Tax=Aspergillus calidoustus TaxID=454130 RepID=A0A0U5GCI8_ASPCI|nr:hypothetical protein ASPCAL12512 [Aspergillus calidoustus]
MLAKSTLTGAGATLLLLLLSSLPSAHAGRASLTLYAGNSCSDTEVTELQPTLSGDGGCGSPITVTRFQSARLNWSSGLSAVALCAQGYSCEDGSLNLIPYTGECVKSYGTFDKVKLCIS